MLKETLQQLAQAGRLRPELADVFAHIVLAALNETALFVTRAGDAAEGRRIGGAAVDDLLDGLFDRPRRG